jgi:hypothetical protein
MTPPAPVTLPVPFRHLPERHLHVTLGERRRNVDSQIPAPHIRRARGTHGLPHYLSHRR